MHECCFFPNSFNGEPTEEFSSSNGIRQGDLLAPYLFFMAMQGFTSTINVVVSRGDMTLPTACDVTVSHNTFVDDLMIFSEAKTEYAKAIRKILEDFVVVCGLELNAAKSQLFLSKGCKKDEIISTLGVEESSFPVRYLGLPLFSRMIKQDMCLHLLDRMRAKLDLWKGRLLSMAGRMELVILTLVAFNIFGHQLFLLRVQSLRKRIEFTGNFSREIKKIERRCILFLGTWFVDRRKEAWVSGKPMNG